jgi:anti-sigma B factor antagonist
VVAGSGADPAGVGADLGARVQHRGIRLGTVVDVILDPRLRTVVGYEIDGVDGITRFLPQIACRQAGAACVDVLAPTAMLSGDATLAFYRRSGVSLSSLEGADAFRLARNGYIAQDGDVTGTSSFHATATDAGNGVARVSVAGEADLYTAPELKAALIGAIDGGARSVLVDLSRTTFIDSTTLGVLMGGVRRLRPNGGEIAIVCRDANIRKIFEITLLDRVFAIFDDADEGIAYLSGSGG